MTDVGVSHTLTFSVTGRDFAAVEDAIARQISGYTGWLIRRDKARIAEVMQDATITVAPLAVAAGGVVLWKADVEVTV